MIYMTNGVDMVTYKGKEHHASLRAAAKRMGDDWYPVSVTADSAPYAKDILKWVSSGATTLSATQVRNSGLRKTNPRTRKPKNPAKSSGVTLISRKGAAVKKTRAKNPAVEKLPYHVQEAWGTGTKRGESASGLHGGTWMTLSKCTTAAIAKWLAEHYSKSHPDATIRVVKV